MKIMNSIEFATHSIEFPARTRFLEHGALDIRRASNMMMQAKDMKKKGFE